MQRRQAADLAKTSNGARKEGSSNRKRGVTELGIKVEGRVLTKEQVGQVQAILSNAGLTDEDKVAAINELLGL